MVGQCLGSFSAQPWSACSLAGHSPLSRGKMALLASSHYHLNRSIASFSELTSPNNHFVTNLAES